MMKSIPKGIPEKAAKKLTKEQRNLIQDFAAKITEIKKWCDEVEGNSRHLRMAVQFADQAMVCVNQHIAKQDEIRKLALARAEADAKKAEELEND